MSQYDNLKATIAANVYENHNNQVTANMVKAAMNAMTDSLGAGYQYLGIATPNTAPGTPDQKVFYIAPPGDYPNFGTGITVNDGEVAILKWDTAWHKEVTGAATSAQVTELGQQVNGIKQTINGALGEQTGKIDVLPNVNYDLNITNNSGSSVLLYIIESNREALIDYINPSTGEKSSSPIALQLNANSSTHFIFLSDNNATSISIVNYGASFANKSFVADLFAYYGDTIKKILVKTSEIEQGVKTMRVSLIDGYNIIPFIIKPQGRYKFSNISANLGPVMYLKTSPDTLPSNLNPSAPGIGSSQYLYGLTNTEYILVYSNNAGIVEITDYSCLEQLSIFDNYKKYGWVATSNAQSGAVKFNIVPRGFSMYLKIQNTTNANKSIFVQIQSVDENGNYVNRYLQTNGEISSSLVFITSNANTTMVIPFTTPEDINVIEIAGTTSWLQNEMLFTLEHIGTYSDELEYNNVEENKRIMASFITMLRNNKVVPRYNRLGVVFCGDSIIGSQLPEITNSAEYDTGDFPPNMSRMIMARKFYDKYKLPNEDVAFRNLKHSAWTKTGTWNTSNGFDNTTQFNKPEVWSAESGATATIAVNGYKYIKVIWSEYLNVSLGGGADYSFKIEFSKDDFATIAKEEIKTITDVRRLMQAFRIFDMSYYFEDWTTETYKVRITPLENPDKALIWGVEMWNNKRLDVIVEAFSGSTAFQQFSWMLDAYNSEYIKPQAFIGDVLVLNDSAYIDAPVYIGAQPHTVENWLSSYKGIFDKINELGAPVLFFAPHYSPVEWLAKGATSIAKKYNTGLIDIPVKLKVDIPEQSITGQDGTHLSNYGNQYYFNELEKIFDNF